VDIIPSATKHIFRTQESPRFNKESRVSALNLHSQNKLAILNNDVIKSPANKTQNNAPSQ